LMERTVMERLILVLIKCFANSSDETKWLIPGVGMKISSVFFFISLITILFFLSGDFEEMWSFWCLLRCNLKVDSTQLISFINYLT
jgi:hypothetical protein